MDIAVYSKNSRSGLWWLEDSNDAKIHDLSHNTFTIFINWTMHCDFIYNTELIQLYTSKTHANIDQNFTLRNDVTADQTEFTFKNLYDLFYILVLKFILEKCDQNFIQMK